MKSPRDILLERHQAAEAKLDTVRRTVVAEVFNNEETKEQSPGAWPVRFLNEILRELIWPCRRVWAGIAVVWLMILVANLAMRNPAQSLAKSQTPSAETVIAFRQQQLFLAELIGPDEKRDADVPKKVLPEPRSQRRNGMLMA